MHLLPNLHTKKMYELFVSGMQYLKYVKVVAAALCLEQHLNQSIIICRCEAEKKIRIRVK